MRWQGQELGVADAAALPGLERIDGLVRSVTTPEFAGMTFHEVMCRSALNHVPGASAMPFDWTVNPYRGCSHACAYCLSPDTLILMADGRQRAIGDLRVGDEIIGTERDGDYRRYVSTAVKATWRTVQRAHRLTLKDGTEIVASGDHRFLSERGWKHVTGHVTGAQQRPYLTTNNRLMGFGAAPPLPPNGSRSSDYRRAYLAGMIRGDGMILHKSYASASRVREIHRFRLALADGEALDRTRTMLLEEGVITNTRPFSTATARRRAVIALHTARRENIARIEQLIGTPADRSLAWHAGFLSGIFDAEGSCARGILRISNKDPEILQLISEALTAHELDHILEPPRPNGVRSVRLLGGLPVRQRFFALCDPAITRKRSVLGTAVKTFADLRIESIEDLGADIEMVDITTGTGDFIASGVISHNCFARGTHEYLDLDAGRDFDSQIIVKVNVADVLAKEVGRASWAREPVMLGTNTDPYQRAEGRYRLMPDIIEALTSSGTPFSILTKGTLLRRDLPMLTDAAASVRVSLAMSIAFYDDALQHAIEPGTPSATARLETVRAATEAGFAVTVFLMPIVPHLTDSIAAIDEGLRRIKAAGAKRVVFGALHLRPGAKQWFMQWLGREHPELVSSYLGLYPGVVSHAPQPYRRWLARRVRPLMRVHGLDGHDEDAHPRGGKPRAAAAAPRFIATGGSAQPERLF